jgi:hypothetical protein
MNTDDNGEYLLGTPFVSKVDWADGLDSKGRPIVIPGHDPSVRGTRTCPSTAGATNWPAPTYIPTRSISTSPLRKAAASTSSRRAQRRMPGRGTSRQPMRRGKPTCARSTRPRARKSGSTNPCARTTMDLACTLPASGSNARSERRSSVAPRKRASAGAGDVNGVPRSAEADFVYLLRGIMHCFKNTGDVDAKFLMVVTGVARGLRGDGSRHLRLR